MPASRCSACPASTTRSTVGTSTSGSRERPTPPPPPMPTCWRGCIAWAPSSAPNWCAKAEAQRWCIIRMHQAGSSPYGTTARTPKGTEPTIAQNPHGAPLETCTSFGTEPASRNPPPESLNQPSNGENLMAAKTVADVMKMVKENEVKFVDFRFTDTRGKEQHVTVPVSHFDEDKFSSGHAFDGSSIAGWKGIEASDMLLMPDPTTANVDPFYEETTLFLSCDVLEPGDGKAYDRDPRSIAKRAEAFLKASGFGDTAFFGPEPEFFIFDDVRWSADASGSFVEIDEYEAPWNTGKKH